MFNLTIIRRVLSQDVQYWLAMKQTLQDRVQEARVAKILHALSQIRAEWPPHIDRTGPQADAWLGYVREERLSFTRKILAGNRCLSRNLVSRAYEVGTSYILLHPQLVSSLVDLPLLLAQTEILKLFGRGCGPVRAELTY